MLKEKIEQAKVFVKEHKKEIVAGLCIAAGGTVLYKICKSEPKFEAINTLIEASSNIKDLDIPKLDVGTIDDLWSDNWGTNLILNDVTVADLGKVGNEFLKIDGVTNDTVVTAVVGLLTKVEQ